MLTMRFITTVLSSLQSRRFILPTLGILTIFCGVAALSRNATARAAGVLGPLSGNWVFTINSTEHESSGSKPAKSKETQLFSIVDSAGTTSNLTMQSQGGEDNVLLVGSRVGNAFYVESADAGMGSEFISISGTIAKPNADGISKSFRATGAAMQFIVGAAPGTSDGIGVSSITLQKVSGKRIVD